MFGQVKTPEGGHVVGGALTFTFQPSQGGAVVQSQTALGTFLSADDNYSYVVQVPAQSKTPGFSLSGNAIVINEPQTYTVAVSYEGQRIGVGNPNTISVTSDSRGSVIQMDIGGVRIPGQETPCAPFGPWPANQADGISGLGMLDWEDCANATNYEVYVWRDGETPPQEPTGVGTTSDHVLAGALDDATVYHWRVIAKNGVVAMPGPTWSFATVGAVLDGNPMDLNGDNQVNALDIQMAINAALGLGGGSNLYGDVNGDGLVSAIDIQMVINGALGIGQDSGSSVALASQQGAGPGESHDLDDSLPAQSVGTPVGAIWSLALLAALVMGVAVRFLLWRRREDG